VHLSLALLAGATHPPFFILELMAFSHIPDIQKLLALF